MPHPHILHKTMGQITATTQTSIKGLYHDSLAMSPLEVELKLALAKGMLMLWSDLCFDMGVSQHLNAASQNELETLLRELDTEERSRFGMAPPET